MGTRALAAILALGVAVFVGVFKQFGGVDAVPICLATTDVEEIIETVVRLAPSFGGINLEDISAPRCFEIERRLQERLDDPKKNWKFNAGDLDDRARWGDFMDAYQTMIERCSTDWAPWHIIPANHKWARNALIASIVRKTLEDMNPKYPKVDWDPKSIKVV